mmetsp:Transcript_4405/g.11256  ORF Transcript_4405/g.11256 Transcript_4405/m.11256 type:complete len:83 (+) Transcript_4405:40-288(+)
MLYIPTKAQSDNGGSALNFSRTRLEAITRQPAKKALVTNLGLGCSLYAAGSSSDKHTYTIIPALTANMAPKLLWLVFGFTKM